MKKIFKKLSKKQPETPLRITNETVSEHRERILAGGRRFKYPIQYGRHKLVINAIALSLGVLILLLVVGWWQLYKVQTTDTFFYRVTKVLPVPVASVDGESVKYSDYLMRYRSQEHHERSKPGQVELNSKDGERLLSSYRRSVLDQVEIDTYAAKRARELSIAVTESEIDKEVNSARETSNGVISQKLYDASIYDKDGYSPDEYRLIFRQSLTRRKVAYRIDEKAEQQKVQIEAQITAKVTDFALIAKTVGGTKEQQVAAGASGLVPRNNLDGGRTLAASKLKVGEISSAIQSTFGNGYYFVKLVNITDKQLSYEFIFVPLTIFDNQFESLKKNGKVNEYIFIPNATAQTIKQ